MVQLVQLVPKEQLVLVVRQENVVLLDGLVPMVAKV
jgi:hypothetical protein